MYISIPSEITLLVFLMESKAVKVPFAVGDEEGLERNKIKYAPRNSDISIN